MTPFLDLKKINSKYRDSINQSVARIIDSGWYILGKEVEEFENEFAKYCGTKYCLGVANGLDALILIFRAYKLTLANVLQCLFNAIHFDLPRNFDL